MTSNFYPPRTLANEEQLEAHEDTARDRIAGWWPRAAIAPQLPCDTQTVVKLCQAVEYQIDADAVLGLLKDQAFPEPKRVKGRLHWMAGDIVNLARAAEARRMWQPFSLLHGFKMTAAEKIGQICEQQGGEMFNDLDRFDFPALLGLLVENCRTPQLVETLALAIKSKLHRSGVL